MSLETTRGSDEELVVPPSGGSLSNRLSRQSGYELPPEGGTTNSLQ
jgi:hypothetical protein